MNPIYIDISDIQTQKDDGIVSHMQKVSILQRAWSQNNPGMAYLYTSRDGERYSSDQFAWVAAHELGHLLGVDDAYDSSTSARNTRSIYNGFGTPVQYIDVMKVLRAFGSNEWQEWS